MYSSNNKRSVATSIFVLVVCLAIVAVFAGIAAVASLNARGFYAGLQLPSWAPPARMFGPVWTILYVLMGVSLWLVVSTARLSVLGVCLALFMTQLSANALWGWIFFQWKSGLFASIEISVLLLLIFGTIREFLKHSHWAAFLLVPYFLWVAYAGVLTVVVWRMNPFILG